MRADYRAWLKRQQYSDNTINTQTSHATRLEQAYGDLVVGFSADRLESIAAALRYSKDDARRGSPNPSKLSINGDLYKALASFRAALGLYGRFLADTAGAANDLPITEVRQSAIAAGERERLSFERDLQKALRREIATLEPGLAIIDEGVERSVPSGFIDITARDEHGAITIIELKAGTADRAAVGQILSYMGDVVDEEPDGAVRGILVAHDFDGKARSAARMVPSLSLRAYSVKFAFMTR